MCKFRTIFFDSNYLLSWRTTVLMGYCPLVNFHRFHLTKWVPTTPSAIQPIGKPSTFCIVWHLVSQSLDVAIFVVLHLNVLWTTYNPQQFTKISVFKVDNCVCPSVFATELKSVAQIEWKYTHIFSFYFWYKNEQIWAEKKLEINGKIPKVYKLQATLIYNSH